MDFSKLTEIQIKTTISELTGLAFIEAVRKKSEEECVHQMEYTNLTYSIIIIDLQNSKFDFIRLGTRNWLFDRYKETMVTYEKGKYIWLEFAKGYGPEKDHLIPTAVVDIIPFLLKLDHGMQGSLEYLAEYVKGVAVLPEVVRNSIIKWFSENDDRRPQWNRRPKRVRTIVG